MMQSRYKRIECMKNILFTQSERRYRCKRCGYSKSQCSKYFINYANPLPARAWFTIYTLRPNGSLFSRRVIFRLFRQYLITHFQKEHKSQFHYSHFRFNLYYTLFRLPYLDYCCTEWAITRCSSSENAALQKKKRENSLGFELQYCSSAENLTCVIYAIFENVYVLFIVVYLRLNGAGVRRYRFPRTST